MKTGKKAFRGMLYNEGTENTATAVLGGIAQIIE